ncbi:MAG: SufE family protein [Hyphomicrobiales bacterium]
MQNFQELVDDFSFLDDWEDRYRYVIELGRELPEMDEADKTDANKVRGCASQVWLITSQAGSDDNPTLTFVGDSDALIVKGLIAIMLSLFSGKTAKDITATDAMALLQDINLQENLSRQRANGLAAMVDRIQREAHSALTGAN